MQRPVDRAAAATVAAQHKVIGLIGGMSWESSALYYRLINERMKCALGKHHNARSVLYTLDFEEVLGLGAAGRWEEVGARLADAAQALANAGADCILLTANTAHLVADQVAAAVDLPLIHIADVTGAAVVVSGLKRVGILGTKPTLESDLYLGYLTDRHGILVDLPDADEREMLHRTILNELALGELKPQSKARCLALIDRLARSGSEGVVVACTELLLLIGQDDTPVPLFDTTQIHVDAAIRFAVGDIQNDHHEGTK